MSERQQLLYEIAGYLGRPNPTVWEQLVDALAFALMDVAAWIDRHVWSAYRCEGRISRWTVIPPHEEWAPIVHEEGILRWIEWYRGEPDGWRPARYV